MFISGFDVVNNDLRRSLLFSELIKKGEDKEQLRLIEGFKDSVDFHPLDEYMISVSAWDHIMTLGIEPKVVFAHPTILQAHPTTSLYYRGLALLSRKRVAQLATQITTWETGNQPFQVNFEKTKKVACVYNTMISSIIEGSTDWTLDNGYRNILATMGITLDGSFRNRIGSQAEDLVKDRIISWLKEKGLIMPNIYDVRKYSLPSDTIMIFGLEPDINFVRNNRSVATIEIKGGRDPAGALERLGAMTKSFSETPSGCINFLIAGVVTPEMRNRLEQMGMIKVYLLDDISHDGPHWDDFTNEVFHHSLRVF